MSGLAPEQIDDLVKSTLDNLGPVGFNLIAQKLVRYPIMNNWFRRNPGPLKLAGGEQISRRLMLTQSETAVHTGLFADDVLAVGNNLQEVKAPWRHTTNNFIYDVSEPELNSGPERLVDLIKTRRLDCMLGLAEKLEAAFFGVPTSTADYLTPWGLKYWLMSNATAGFNGGNVSGFSDGPGGVNATTYPNWCNYTGSYTAFTEKDLVAKLRKGFRAIGFQSPVDEASIARPVGNPQKILCGEDVIEGLIAIARAQNDNLGSDLAAYDESVTLHRLPFQYVPQIDVSYTTTPIFMLDASELYLVMHSFNNFRQSGPKEVAGKHDVRAVFVDVTYNMFCTNRRRQAYFYKA